MTTAANIRSAIRRMREDGHVCRVQTQDSTARIRAATNDDALVEAFILEWPDSDEPASEISPLYVCSVLNDHDFRVVDPKNRGGGRD